MILEWRYKIYVAEFKSPSKLEQSSDLIERVANFEAVSDQLLAEC